MVVSHLVLSLFPKRKIINTNRSISRHCPYLGTHSSLLVPPVLRLMSKIPDYHRHNPQTSSSRLCDHCVSLLSWCLRSSVYLQSMAITFFHGNQVLLSFPSSSPSSPSPLLWSNVLSVSNQWQLSLYNFPFQQLHELCVCSFYLGFASCLLDDLTRQMIEWWGNPIAKFQDNDWKALWLSDLNNDCGFPSLYFD